MEFFDFTCVCAVELVTSFVYIDDDRINACHRDFVCCVLFTSESKIGVDPEGVTTAGVILCMRPANERRRYNVTSSLIDWVHAQNDPCKRVDSSGAGQLGPVKDLFYHARLVPNHQDGNSVFVTLSISQARMFCELPRSLSSFLILWERGTKSDIYSGVYNSTY